AGSCGRRAIRVAAFLRAEVDALGSDVASSSSGPRPRDDRHGALRHDERAADRIAGHLHRLIRLLGAAAAALTPVAAGPAQSLHECAVRAEDHAQRNRENDTDDDRAEHVMSPVWRRRASPDAPTAGCRAPAWRPAPRA